jgi:uncharacterized protein YndB with AHSA1/START domain
MKNQVKVTAEVGKQEHFIIREFDAPREMVFKAFTDPELIVQWLVAKEQIDYLIHKTGGSYRYLMPDPTGKEIGLSGVFHEVLAPERIIETFEWEGLPERGHVALKKTMFETLPNKRTKVTLHYICESVVYRDGLINSGMELHTSHMFNKLEELLIKQTQ